MRNRSINQNFWYGRCLLMITLLFGTLPGCNQTASPKNDAQDKTVSAPDTPDKESLSSRPDVAVQGLLAAVQAGDAGVIWDSLPARHHVEINGIIRGFAAKMDREVWERAFKVARRIVNVLRSKPDLIFKNPDLKSLSVNVRLFSENWDEVIDLVQLLVDSDLADLDKLRAFDGKSFFNETGTRFLKQLVALSAKDPNDPFRKGFEAEVRLIVIDGSAATIGLETGGTFVMTRQAVDGESRETQMKVLLVDDTWIVEELHYGLSKLYVDGRAMVAGIPDDGIRNNRDPLIKLLETVEEDIGRIELAKTSRQVVQALALAQLRVSQLISAGAPADSETAGDSTPRGRTVTVVINGEMDKAARERILGRLESLKRPGGKSKVIDGQETVTIIIPTNRFLQDVVDSVDFGLVADVDEVERRLTVTLKPKPVKKAKQGDPGK